MSTTTTTVARAFAPASVSNVACGFDILGFAIAGPGDEVTARRCAERGARLGEIRGDDGRLPLDPRRNTATVAAQALLDRIDAASGVRLDLHKRMPLASGLGSSAASAVAAVVAVDALLGSRLPRVELLACALAGEVMASGASHADNLAPSLYGGFTLVRSLEPTPDVVTLPTPAGLSCAVLHPQLQVETKAARERLGTSVTLKDAVTQWGNVAALVAALFRNDLELLSRALHDVIAEPLRAPMVAGFREVQQAALDHGALGCSLSGSGPASFALCANRALAERVGRAMLERLREATGIDGDLYVSALDVPGARLLDPPAV